MPNNCNVKEPEISMQDIQYTLLARRIEDLERRVSAPQYSYYGEDAVFLRRAKKLVAHMRYLSDVAIRTRVCLGGVVGLFGMG